MIFEGASTEKILHPFKILEPVKHYHVDSVAVLKSRLARRCSLSGSWFIEEKLAWFVITFKKPATKLRESQNS